MSHFTPSSTFAGLVEAEKQRRTAESRRQQYRRSRAKRDVRVKIGHGGTLDPGATGVLIIGVGNGTKQLQKFLSCTKTYETVVLFGAATDSYDGLGKVVARKSAECVSEAKVREALGSFRGDIMQRPPLYSALHLDGKRLYEYAREGKELPREIEERPVKVDGLELVKWMDAGTHEFSIPEDEAPEKEREVVEKVLHLGNGARPDANNRDLVTRVEEGSSERDMKRRRGEEGDASEAPARKREIEGSHHTDTADMVLNDSLQFDSDLPPQTSNLPRSSAPAARLRITSGRGFYVRSLCHDLGRAAGSLGLMADLVRTKQDEFELGKNVLEYGDLARGEDVWGPKIKGMLEGSPE